MVAPANAVNTVVKPSLINEIGVSLSTLVILENARKCALNMFTLDRDGYTALIRAVASDERVKKTFGEEGTQAKQQEWLAAID